ncbi:MAG: 3-hydroxyacyl-CoA dehydrogenase family protein, partial [Ilumatobacteraceae bacterium]
VGSGIMGAGIVEVVASAGFEVIVRARTEEGAAAVVAQVASRLQRSVDKGRLEATEADATVSRISHTSHLGELAACELVLETVIEDLEVKRRLVSELDDLLDPAAIIATNTSTLPVVELAVATTRPDRVCGLHFFNPATAMPLVEIVTPVTVAESTIALVERFAADCGKESIRVADRAGFVVNALLFPYLNAAIALAERGVANRVDVDRAMRGGCNFPMGPFELLDLIGLDTTLRILETLHRETGDPASLPHPELRRLVAAGHLGRKTGRGFLEYGT